jgi:hypothetical protein
VPTGLKTSRHGHWRENRLSRATMGAHFDEDRAMRTTDIIDEATNIVNAKMRSQWAGDASRKSNHLRHRALRQSVSSGNDRLPDV